MRFAVPLMSAFFSLPPSFAAQAADMRKASEQEIKSFGAFYQARFPNQNTLPPVLSVTRQPGARQWRISATVDSVPGRGLPPLCKMTRSRFTYDAGAQKDQRWMEQTPAGQFIWFDRSATCRPSPHPVKLLHPLPDTEAIALMNQQTMLLQRARLLMAGNTMCAKQRALNFQLSAIEAGSPAEGNSGMFGLVFESDRDSVAQVWVKQYRNEWTAWNVVCPAP